MSEIIVFSTFPYIIFITTSMSNSYIISYNLAGRTFYITYLNFIKDQYMIIALLVIFAK